MSGSQIPVAVELALIAANKRLVIYAGAGLSLAAPTNIPNGAEVARRCYNRLLALLGPEALDGADQADLVSVADTVAGNATSADLARRTALSVAGFTEAKPNYGHEILALLLLEGIAEIFTTNWDDCIERAGGNERILTVVTDNDRREIEKPALFKVHGCATRPATALITGSSRFSVE